MNRKEKKKLWIQKWKAEISHQKFKSYLINKRGKTSKEFKQFVKNFYLVKTNFSSVELVGR
tara:strand:- start:4418 stop:4600 length:183 start_codon:yes stop_codon:yes gene_type:complete